MFQKLVATATILVSLSSTYIVDKYAEQTLFDHYISEGATQAEEWANRPEPEPEVVPEVIASHWLALADCESGEWDRHSNPISGSRRWDYGAPGAFTRPNYPFHGGLNFHPDTWNWVAPMVGLGHIEYAYQATPEEQVKVGEKTQELQGWRAWPVCSKKVGLR